MQVVSVTLVDMVLVVVVELVVVTLREFLQAPQLQQLQEGAEVGGLVG